MKQGGGGANHTDLKPDETKKKCIERGEISIKFILFFFFFCAHFHFPASGQAVVTGVIPSPPRFLPSILIAHRAQQSRCSSLVHRVLLTHALPLSASQFVHKKKSQRIHASMHSAGLELTKLTYTRLEDNLIRHRGDRYLSTSPRQHFTSTSSQETSSFRCSRKGPSGRTTLSSIAFEFPTWTHIEACRDRRSTLLSESFFLMTRFLLF